MSSRASTSPTSSGTARRTRRQPKAGSKPVVTAEVPVAALATADVPVAALATAVTSPAVPVEQPQALVPPKPGDLDLHLFGEGRHERLWEVLGAHRYEGGTAFAVWAPNAEEVRVVGDTPGWGCLDGVGMTELGTSGVWHATVPGVGIGERYKYRIRCKDGQWREKADPMAQATECPPATASVVYQSSYVWQDGDWMRQRAIAGPHHQRPMSIYEVHLGSWRPGLSYVEMADQLADYVTDPRASPTSS